MLMDSESYESEVRIGSMFQAEVPEWAGPISRFAHLLLMSYFKISCNAINAIGEATST
jgi:hypothetical protein